ncbi:MAG: prolyl oligopeptidase family serine peptidase [Lutibacter sp.]
MHKIISSFFALFIFISSYGQKVMTPETLIQLNRVSGIAITKDQNFVIYRTSKYSIETNKTTKTYYKIPVTGGNAIEINDFKALINDPSISSNNLFKIFSKDVKLQKITGQDFYPKLKNSNVKIITSLNYRHWDTWEDGAFSHVFYKNLKTNKETDIMPNESFDCPQKPFGGTEDYIWSPTGSDILYVTKKLSGTAYAVSTNTDIYQYNLETKKTINLTKANKGYDTNPAFSSNGTLAYLQMKRDGYESDKNDIIALVNNQKINLTKDWDGTVSSFKWSLNGKKIFYVAPYMGTVQLFKVKVPKNNHEKLQLPEQITTGQFDIGSIIGQSKNTLVVSRRDMNHATELYTVNLKNGTMKQLTHANDAVYNSIKLSKVVKRMVKTTDGKELLAWVIYPPNFDASKKYPTLLYCQGGPQAEVSQFYSFRWNFQLMAAHNYIVIAPNRRGLPGFGVAWNEQISKDYGGQNMQDYLATIDDIAKEPYVDKSRLGAIGASYGGYSIYNLAGIHQGRFKTFIAHDGIFDWRSMYGTTEELFFVNWDLGGPYWDKSNKVAQKAYHEFNPAEKVQNWDTPIMIIQGGIDYRVPVGQGLAAFQAAQLKGLKSKLLYFPNENHWVLHQQNSLIWEREFYKWLKETL